MSDIEGHITNPGRCPNCGRWDTEQVFADTTMADVVRKVYVCNACNGEYTVEFGDPMVVDYREP